MSRRDGNFPSYNQLRIDATTPPEDLFQRGSRKCKKCGKQWPGYAIFQPSPCCEVETTASGDTPDMPWKDAVSGLLHARFERLYAKWNDSVTDEAILWDDTIQLDFRQPFDEEAFVEGMEEIERLIGERPTTSTENQ